MANSESRELGGSTDWSRVSASGASERLTVCDRPRRPMIATSPREQTGDAGIRDSELRLAARGRRESSGRDSGQNLRIGPAGGWAPADSSETREKCELRKNLGLRGVYCHILYSQL